MHQFGSSFVWNCFHWHSKCVLIGYTTANVWTLKMWLCLVFEKWTTYSISALTLLKEQLQYFRRQCILHTPIHNTTDIILWFMSSFFPRFPCCSGHRLSLLSLSICLPVHGAPLPGWRPMMHWLAKAPSKASPEAKNIRPGPSTTLGA